MRPAGDRHARAAARAAAQAAIDAASDARARGVVAEPEWQRRVTDALAELYLADLGDDDPRWESGFDGDAARWREARALVLGAVPADAPSDGSLLDVGCATGHLMECLAAWGQERGLTLTPYGLELNPDLAAAARRRLPAWADRIYTGNVSHWAPPRRFTYVHTGLEYVAPGSDFALVARLLRDVVAPGGRLIVGPVSGADVAAAVEAFAAAGVSNPGVLGASDPAWPALFGAERARVLAALGPLSLAVEHVGSTAVPGLAAKPILDLMGGRPAGRDLAPDVAALEGAGYGYRGEFGIPGRHYFVCDDADGRRTHHLHLVEHGGAFWHAHLAFRDYLRRVPARAAAYAALKRDLAVRHPRDRAAYTDGKAAFVAETLALAADAG